MFCYKYIAFSKDIIQIHYFWGAFVTYVMWNLIKLWRSNFDILGSRLVEEFLQKASKIWAKVQETRLYDRRE